MKTTLKSGTVLVSDALLFLATEGFSAATNDLTSVLQKGLFEEEANHNLNGAIQAYQSVIAQFDKDRKLAATAIFRLGECYRKQGKTNDALVQFQRVLSEFPDQTPLIAPSRQNLTLLGGAPASTASPALSDAARQEQKRLLAEELALVEKKLAAQQNRLQAGVGSQEELWATQRELLQLKRQIAGLEAGLSPQLSAAGNGPAGPLTSAEADELKSVEATIKNSPDLINAPDASGQTLLQKYCAKGNLAIVKLLLDNGAAVDGITHPELTPLHYAAGNGHKAVVAFLLSKGAKTDVVTESGVAPLHIAVQKGYELVAKLLLDAGTPVNAKVTRRASRSGPDLTYTFFPGNTPLQIACANGYRALVDLLISKGADVNTQDTSGGTPLTAAVGRNDEAMVKALLAAQASVYLGGSGALRAAAGNGNIPILELLLKRATDLNTNVPSLLSDAVAGKHPEAVKLLIQFKVDPNVKEQNGWPVSFRALGDPPTLRALLEGGADPNQRNPNGESLLDKAILSNYPQCVPVLLDTGADPNARNFNGATPLHIAANWGAKAAAELLLKHGAKVDAQSDQGQTPLHLAAQANRVDVAALLLANGANPNIRSASGLTPLDLAKDAARSSGLIPFASPPPAPLKPGSASPVVATNPPSMVDLLRQHGAAGDLPHMDQIEIVRSSAKYAQPVFFRGTNTVNRFSLLEAIAAHYGFVSLVPELGTRNYSGVSHTAGDVLAFPNLAQIVVRHAKPDGNGWDRPTIVSLETILLQSADCSKDIWLQWGDQIDIPEADHPLHAVWKGLDREVLNRLSRCLARQVQIIVKGQTNELMLKINASPEQQSPWIRPPNFCLKPALLSSGFVLASSDLSRVKLKRHDSVTGQKWELIQDCSVSPQPVRNPSTRDIDIWLRDGDLIEVPEKP